MNVAQKPALQDPVCGMLVKEKTAAGHVSYEGKDYYFCCPRCGQQFEQNPAHYVNRSSALPVVGQSHCGCGCGDEQAAKQTIVPLRGGAKTVAKPAAETTPVLHHDPVCGMDIEEQDAVGTVEHGGTRYYFCSSSCLDKFKISPEKYLAPETAASAAPAGTQDVEYTCPMDPEVRRREPGACPKCGMALEPATFQLPATRTEYTCPMHPEIVRSEPGSCPICGMALEPREVTGEEVNPELADMTRRLRISALLTAPLLIFMVLDMIPGAHRLSTILTGWLQFALATPIVLWGGWPFFERGWASVVNRHLNMFTLIALGTGASYLFSLVALLFPFVIPASFRVHADQVPLYFEPLGWWTPRVKNGTCPSNKSRLATPCAFVPEKRSR